METLQDKQLKSLEKLIELVKKENQRQVDKFGIQNETFYKWLVIAGEEYGELCQAVLDYDFGKRKEKILKEAIQVVTVVLKIAESCLIENKEEDKIK